MAKRSILDILINVIKKGDGDQQMLKGLTQVKSAISQAGMVFGALTGMAYTLNKAFQATGGEFVKYAGEVRDLSQAFGLEAEDASRLIQVMDDLGISQETLTKALKTMASNGIQPSLAGLQQLATQYNSIPDPAKQAAFLTEQFGKSGLGMAAAMKVGADGLQDMNDATEEGLVLTQTSLEEARKYEIQVDQLGDTWKAFAMTIGQAVVPALNDLLLTTIATKNATEAYRKENGWFTNEAGKLNEAIAEEKQRLINLQQAQIDAESGGRDLAFTEEELAKQTWDAEAATRALAAGLSGDLADAMETNAEKSAQLQEEYWDLQAQLSGLLEGGLLEKEAKEFEEVNSALNGNVEAQRKLAVATQESINKILYQKVAMHLSTKDALNFARTLGLISETDYAMQTSVDMLTEKFDTNHNGWLDSTEDVEGYLKELQKVRDMILKLPEEIVVDVVVNYITQGTPPPTGGGGGGGNNPPPAPPADPQQPMGMSGQPTWGNGFDSAQGFKNFSGVMPVRIVGGNVGGDRVSFAGATFNVYPPSGADMSDLLQMIMDASGR